MSRSGYGDDYDYDDLALGRWRGVVASSIRGKRGQAFLVALRDALDEMPEKRLIAGDLEHGGEVCAIGALGRRRGVNMSSLNPDDSERVASTFDIADPLAREVVFMNDEGHYGSETAEERWTRMREWVSSNIKPAEAA